MCPEKILYPPETREHLFSPARSPHFFVSSLPAPDRPQDKWYPSRLSRANLKKNVPARPSPRGPAGWTPWTAHLCITLCWIRTDTLSQNYDIILKWCIQQHGNFSIDRFKREGRPCPVHSHGTQFALMHMQLNIVFMLINSINTSFYINCHKFQDMNIYLS